MSSEMDMPVLKVLTVAEVPTEKADPVDPVARQQAKVCTGAGHVTGLSYMYFASRQQARRGSGQRVSFLPDGES